MRLSAPIQGSSVEHRLTGVAAERRFQCGRFNSIDGFVGLVGPCSVARLTPIHLSGLDSEG